MLKKYGAKRSQSIHKESAISNLERVKSEKIVSLSELSTETCSQTPKIKSVRFSQSHIHMKPVKQTSRSPSILKQSRFTIKTQKKMPRSNSITSLADQNPIKDDQSCQNTELNRRIKEEYQSIMKKFSKRGSYHDELFPHVTSSITPTSSRNKQQITKITWMRIPEIYPNNQLLVIGPQPGRNLIKASEKVSDYFLLGLNCIKYSKCILKKLFEDQKCNQQGVYYVKIFHGNVWKYVLIDDYIPVVGVEKKKNQFVDTTVFTYHGLVRKTNQPIEIWPLLLQKAFAKLYRSYSALKSGNIFDFLEELTNFPYQFYDLQNKQCNLKEVIKWREIVAFGETLNGEKVPLEMGVGQSEKIMFTLGEDDRKQIIEYKELPQYFEGIYIFSGKKYSYVGHCPIKQNRESVSIRKFTLLTKTSCSLTLLQKDEKFYNDVDNFKYCWVRLMLFQKELNNQGFRWVDGRYDNFKSLTLEEELEAGDYFLIVIPEWQQKQRFLEMNLIIRCKIPTILDRFVYRDGTIEEGCTDLAQRFGVLNQINKDICSYNCIHQDMGMIIENFNNEREKGYVRITKKISLQRSLNKESQSLLLEPVNAEFKRSLKAQINIKGGQHYTLVMITRGGVNRQALQNFNFTI